MFLLLENDKVIGFWANKVGDEFLENTAKHLNLDISKVKLLHFEDLKQVPDFYDLSKNELTIKERIVTIKKVTKPTMVSNKLEDGTVVEKEEMVEQDVEEERFNDIEILDGELFFQNGKFLKEC